MHVIQPLYYCTVSICNQIKRNTKLKSFIYSLKIYINKYIKCKLLYYHYRGLVQSIIIITVWNIRYLHLTIIAWEKTNPKSPLTKTTHLLCFFVILAFIVNAELLITFKQFLLLKFENKVIKYFLVYLLIPIAIGFRDIKTQVDRQVPAGPRIN